VQTMGHLFDVFRGYLTGSSFEEAYENAKMNTEDYLS